MAASRDIAAMNITLLGHHDIASLYALDRVIRQLPDHRHTVLLSSAAKPRAADDSALGELMRFDAELCMRFMSAELAGPVVQPLAAAASGSFDNPNSARGLATFRRRRPDLVLSIRYRRILHADAIAIPRLGVLNLHSGILPTYRGVMATFWAMLNDEAQIGTTLHRIVDAGIDTGPVIDIHRRETRKRRSYLANVLGLYAGGCDTLVSAVNDLASGKPLPAVPQTGGGRYFRAPAVRDVRRFEAAGLRLVDHREAAEIT